MSCDVFRLILSIIGKIKECFSKNPQEKKNLLGRGNTFNITVNINNSVQNSKKFSGGYGSMEDYIGTIKMFAGNYEPEGWMICDGRLLQISQYSALFSVIGTTYGGDGRAYFALPDFRGRSPVGAGRGNGLTQREIGEQFGSEKSTLHKNNVPFQVSDPVIPTQGISNYSVTYTEPTPFEIVQPSIGVNYIICWHGIYPQRQ